MKRARNYLTECYKSEFYAQRNERFYEDFVRGKPVKSIAQDAGLTFQNVYRCIRRVKKARLEYKSNRGPHEVRKYYYLTSRPQSTRIAERDARWAHEYASGKTVKQIAATDYSSEQHIYRSIRRAKRLGLEVENG